MKNSELKINKENNPEESKEKRILEEYENLNLLYSDLSDEMKVLVTPLLQNAAFMKISLEDLQDTIILEGVTERYQNGANQFGTKQSAALQSYNALIKNYTALQKKLADYLPPKKKEKLPPVISGKTITIWESEKEMDAIRNPKYAFMSLKDYIQEMLEQPGEEPEEAPDPEVCKRKRQRISEIQQMRTDEKISFDEMRKMLHDENLLD